MQKQGQKFLDVDRDEGRREVHDEGAELGGRRRARGRVACCSASLLVVVVSIYMLLDMQRLAAAVDRRFPPLPGSTPLITRMERALASYVKGQLALSVIIGASSGLGVWVLGMLGLMPNGGKYALLFGVWAGITELIPYVGPWLGAAPPVLYALVQHPLSALWVALLFLAIQQLEGHVVVPKVMGQLAAAAPAARHLRPARRRRDLRLPRHPRRAAAARRRARGVGVLLRARRARALARGRRRSTRRSGSRS